MDNKTVSIKDFIDRILYLNAQMNLVTQFAPMKVLGDMRYKSLHISEREDFDRIREIYHIPATDVIVDKDIPYDHYKFYIGELEVTELEPHKGGDESDS